VRELERLRAVEVTRKGRDVAVRLDAESKAGGFLATVEAPDPPF
jgi:hypothetical protein